MYALKTKSEVPFKITFTAQVDRDSLIGLKTYSLFNLSRYDLEKLYS